jgi:hypothetical protein
MVPKSNPSCLGQMPEAARPQLKEGHGARKRGTNREEGDMIGQGEHNQKQKPAELS